MNGKVERKGRNCVSLHFTLQVECVIVYFH